MKQLNSRPIIYFSLGLLVGSGISYLFEFSDKYSLELTNAELSYLLNLLPALLMWGILCGGLTVLLSRGVALVFLTETKAADIKLPDKPKI